MNKSMLKKFDGLYVKERYTEGDFNVYRLCDKKGNEKSIFKLYPYRYLGKETREGKRIRELNEVLQSLPYWEKPKPSSLQMSILASLGLA